MERGLQPSGDDVYPVAAGGDIILNYDHHFMADGLDVWINDVKKAGKLIQAMNRLGAEFEVFFWPPRDSTRGTSGGTGPA